MGAQYCNARKARTPTGFAAPNDASTTAEASCPRPRVAGRSFIRGSFASRRESRCLHRRPEGQPIPRASVRLAGLRHTTDHPGRISFTIQPSHAGLLLSATATRGRGSLAMPIVRIRPRHCERIALTPPVIGAPWRRGPATTTAARLAAANGSADRHRRRRTGPGSAGGMTAGPSR